MRHAFALLLSAFCTAAAHARSAAQGTSAGDVFRFHVPNEPSSLDPAQLSSTDANYLFHNLYRGLYRWTPDGKLLPEGAHSCSRPALLRIVCKLDPSAGWSDGRDVVAEDYARAFRRLVAPTSKNLGVELLQNVAGAMDSFSGKSRDDALGVRALGKHELEIRLIKPDPDFLHKLASPLLVPVRADAVHERERAAAQAYNGPYKIESWDIGKKIRLAPNPRYPRGFATRPPVEVLVVDEDTTALALYEEGRLTFLRRLPTALIAKFRARPDFRRLPMARFDYIGFGPELKDQPQMRKALALSLDFAELQRIYDSPGTPGCPSLPEDYMDKVPCLKFDVAAAKAAWAGVDRKKRGKRYTLAFSALGGDDVKKGSEWAQQQWRARLGARIDLAQTEQALYLRTLRENAPPIFRKGVGLDRPTCLAALETFAPGGAENFPRLDLPAYNATIAKLSAAATDAERRRLCTQGVRNLVDGHWLIPLGRIHFALLASPRFQGWELNEMNQLDLAELRRASP